MEHLSSVSPYFENAFKGSFREATEKQIGLPNVEPDTFSIYVEWWNSYQIVDTDGKAFNGENTKPGTSRRLILLKLYVFADEYDNPQLRRDVLHVFVRYTNKCTEYGIFETVSEAYDRLPSNSPLLRFLVDHYAYE